MGLRFTPPGLTLRFCGAVRGRRSKLSRPLHQIQQDASFKSNVNINRWIYRRHNSSNIHDLSIGLGPKADPYIFQYLLAQREQEASPLPHWNHFACREFAAHFLVSSKKVLLSVLFQKITTPLKQLCEHCRVKLSPEVSESFQRSKTRRTFVRRSLSFFFFFLLSHPWLS